MRTHNYRFMLYFITIFLGLMFFLPTQDKQEFNKQRYEHRRSSSSPKASIEMKKGRWEYFHRMLRDPATGEIPRGIRQKELAFAKELQEKSNSLQKTANIMDLGWKEAGPVDVGGRTRALAVDVTNPNTILAGGVSGGIWKSTDKGATWQMKSTTSQILSVTSIAQDTRSGHTDTWYYTSGEYSGSANDRGRTAWFYGGGIYKSTDNGETWNLLPNNTGNNPTRWDSDFDYVSKIVVNHLTGNVFIASNSLGIMKSNDGGNSFSLVLGGNNEHIYSDIVVASDGTLIASLSKPYQGFDPQNTPGVYKSTNDGASWTNITPNNFPTVHERSVLASAPSNPSVAYIITNTGDFLDEEKEIEKITFFKINVNNGSSEDRSQNLPEIEAQYSKGRINTQWNYNLVMAVKPDNENFVMIGATSLFKSEDGFATKPTDPLKSWIGGYSANPDHFPFYPNFHPDVHSFAFSPNNPNEMWWGHDGGLTFTDQLNNTTYTERFPWSNMNNGYNVTQFYNIAISSDANDNRIIGGTQDNGTPFFTFDGNNISESIDASLADGSYCYLGKQYAYTSIQKGLVYRIGYHQDGTPYDPWGNEQFSVVTPSEANGQLFIDPFAIDPTDENIMYYLAGNVVWRNNALSSIPDKNYNKTSIGWTELTNTKVPDGYSVSTIASSHSNPSHVLYYGASTYENPPKIYKLVNANTSTNSPTDISISGSVAGAYVHNIAVNPDNGNEIIVVLSNYNIVGLYHSTNGGQSFTAIEGNLEGNDNNPGPSIRAATILPTSNGTLYLVATSTGVYSTSQLNGSQTIWNLEGPNTIGNVVVETITSRKSDGRIVSGTHGRGAFVGQAEAAGAAVATASVTSLTLQSRPGQTGSTNFVLGNDGEGTLNYNISVNGNFGGTFPKSVKKGTHIINSELVNKSSINIEKQKIQNPHLFPKLEVNSMQNPKQFKSPSNANGNDVLWLDDGNEGPDDFDGWDNGWSMYWANEFNLQGNSFELEAIQFVMRTEQSFTNEIYYFVNDASLNLLADGYLSLDLSQTGSWYTIPLNSSISFADGQTFYIGIESNSPIYYPAGIDYNAQVTGKSYYYNWNTFTWDNINSFSGYENAAYLIRAMGTLGGGGGGNQDPVAVASVSKTQAEVDETITFDGSQSYDNDGNITLYQWDFGDGTTSTQQTATHAYTQANTYNYRLTVTDNQGATGQTSGQIVVSDVSNQYVTVEPSSGAITPGGSETITLTLNAQNINEGTYTGQVNITTNGGNITIPIDYLVDVEILPDIPTEFSLSQNYPNPFNPSTSIEFSVPKTTNVSLKIFDMLGREVAVLLDGKKSLGAYKVNFNASSLASGIYVYRLESDEFIDTKKFVLLK